jgi:hypothetical protein
MTDIDDTLTVNGRLPAAVFVAMERLKDAGIRSIPITGRPAGWCDHIARMWPVDGLVGENGAFYFRYDASTRKMLRRYFKPDNERRADRLKLEKLKLEILQKIPEANISADQAARRSRRTNRRLIQKSRRRGQSQLDSRQRLVWQVR